MNIIKMLMVTGFILFFGSAIVLGGPTEAEKKLAVEITTALNSKNFAALPGLIDKLKGEDITNKLRFYYCQQFVLSPKFSGNSLKASLGVLVFMYNKSEEEPHVRKGVLRLMQKAIAGVKRDGKKFAALLQFYKEVSNPADVARIRKMMGRFREDADVINSLCDALENQRVKESINILSGIFYQSWLRTDTAGTNVPPDHQKFLVFFSRINGKMRWALASLSGQKVRSPEQFNRWWVNNRGKFKVPPKKEEKKDKKEDKKDKDKDIKDKDKKEDDKKEKEQPPVAPKKAEAF